MPDSQPAPPAAPVSSDASESVTADLACVGCGYNLRGLRRAGDCPECGKPVAETIKARAGLFGDAAWIRRMAMGCDLLLIAPVWVPVVAVLGGAMAAALGALSHVAATIGFVVLPLGILGVVAFGAALLTSPEPGETDGPARLVRRSARAVMGVAMAGSLLLFVVVFGDVTTKFVLLILLGMPLASFLVVVLLNVYCAMIARRMGESVIGRMLMFCTAAIVGAVVLTACFSYIGVLALAGFALLGAAFAALMDWVALASFRTELGRRLERVEQVK